MNDGMPLAPIANTMAAIWKGLLALTLVDALHGPFEPERYVDQYRANLLRIIDAKSKAKKADLPSGKPEWGDGKVLDLMQKLEASLRQGRAAKPKNGAPKAKAATKHLRTA